MSRNHLLVDASVARSVADPARHPTSVACLALIRLLQQSDCSTGVLMTPELQREWKEHVSHFMSSWLANMEMRGRVRREKDRPVRDLRTAIGSVADAGNRAALEKDIHLTEAAILHGLPVASRDDRQRRYLSELASNYPNAGRIQWFNPVTEPQQVWADWVSDGCQDRNVFLTAGGSAAP